MLAPRFTKEAVLYTALDCLVERAEDLERRRGRNEISSTPSHPRVSSPFSAALNAPVPLDTRCGDIPAFVCLMWFSFSRLGKARPQGRRQSSAFEQMFNFLSAVVWERWTFRRAR